MKYRMLRIAWSVAWGVVAVLLCVLWVRSYLINEILFRLDPGNQVTTLGSGNGTCYFVRMLMRPRSFGPPQPPPAPHSWKYSGAAPADNVNRSFKFSREPNGYSFYIPFWLFVGASAAIGAAPWFTYRFSLRTLLIVTTLVAVGLGLVVWMV